MGLILFPGHLATPEKLAELESEMSAGTLRDIFSATRCLEVINPGKDAPPSDKNQRRAAAKELIALLGASGKLERQWLANLVFKYLYYRPRAEMDQIEWELMKAVAEKVPDFLMNRSDGSGHSYAEGFSRLKQKRETETSGAAE